MLPPATGEGPRTVAGQAAWAGADELGRSLILAIEGQAALPATGEGLAEVIGRKAGISPAYVDEDEAARRLTQPDAVEALAAAIHSASGHWTVAQRYSLDQCECRRRATEALAYLDAAPFARRALRARLAATTLDPGEAE